MSADEYLDLEECAKDGISKKGATRFRVRIDSKCVEVDGDTVTGRQLLDKANRKEEQQESIFVKRKQDGLEEIDIYRPIDLTQEGIECFQTLVTSTRYDYKLNGEDRFWFENLISGRALKEKAGVDPDKFYVWEGSPDNLGRKLADNRYYNLSDPVEFSTTPMEAICG